MNTTFDSARESWTLIVIPRKETSSWRKTTPHQVLYTCLFTFHPYQRPNAIHRSCQTSERNHLRCQACNHSGRSTQVLPIATPNMHELHYHPDVDFMRAQVQQHYVVLELRNTLRKIESSYLVCRLGEAETLPLMMADLPNERCSCQNYPSTWQVSRVLTSVSWQYADRARSDGVSYSYSRAWQPERYI